MEGEDWELEVFIFCKHGQTLEQAYEQGVDASCLSMFKSYENNSPKEVRQVDMAFVGPFPTEQF